MVLPDHHRVAVAHLDRDLDSAARYGRVGQEADALVDELRDVRVIARCRAGQVDAKAPMKDGRGCHVVEREQRLERAGRMREVVVGVVGGWRHPDLHAQHVLGGGQRPPAGQQRGEQGLHSSRAGPQPDRDLLEFPVAAEIGERRRGVAGRVAGEQAAVGCFERLGADREAHGGALRCL